MNELLIIISSLKYNLDKLTQNVDSFYIFISSLLVFILAPTGNPWLPTAGVFLFMGLDVLTRIYANCVNNNGLINAIKTKKILSEDYYYGLCRKLIRNGFLMIVAGWSLAIIPAEGAGLTVYSVIYGTLFLGEVISNLENLIEAGHTSLKSYLDLFKKTKRSVMQNGNGNGNGYANRKNKSDGNDK